MKNRKIKRTKIVCTIGPASDNYETIVSMIDEGMNVARINCSHGSHSEHKKKIDLIKKARNDLNIPIAIMLDTKGPEIRTGLLKDGKQVELKKGEPFALVTKEVIGNEKEVSVSYEDLPKDIKVGDLILIDDGLIELGVDKVKKDRIDCVVINEGMLGERKSINIPNVSINLPGLTKKDEEDLIFGINEGVDFVAASFIRKAQDVLDIRHVLDNNGGSDIMIISKIENHEGVSNINEIIDVSDGIMVARGDLGVEVPAQDVPLIQKKIIQKCINAAKPVITATQMLDSMIRHPRPTRAEVADVANAVFDGTDAVMLSGETASGEYPIQAVKIMTEIVEVAEVADEFKLRQRIDTRQKGISNAVCDACVTISVNLNTSAIIAATSSGITARAISKYRPDAIILGSSFSERTIRQLCLSWGVYGIYVLQMANSEILVRESVKVATKEGWIKEGQKVVFAAGVPVGATGTTNMLRVISIGYNELNGIGNGVDAQITGIARILRINNPEALENFNEGDILVVPRVTKENRYLAEMAAGVITDDPEDRSIDELHELKNKPMIFDVGNVFENIRNGTLITMNSKTGVIKQGN